MRAPTPTTCPSCAMVSVRAPHYCPGCGYDYWRSAAGLTLAPPLATPAPPQADGRLSAVLMGAGLLGLVITGIVTAVVVLGGLEPEPEVPLIANTLPSRGPEDFLILRFFREARDPRAAFTVSRDATLRQIEPPDPGVIVVSESVVLHGDNWIGDSTAVSGAETIQRSVAHVDGVYYQREGADATWTEVDVFGDAGPVSPFARIATVSEIEYLGLESMSGTTLHHLLVTKWLGGSGLDFRILGFDRVVERENRFEIWVNDDGVPIRARHISTVAVVEGGVPYIYTVDAQLTFRDWDMVEPIESPNDAPPPAPEPDGGPSAHGLRRLA